MDGTLFNSEIFHTKALVEIGHKFKVIPPFGPEEVHMMLMGKADHLIYDIVKEWEGFPQSLTLEEFIKLKNDSLEVQLSNSKADEFFPRELFNLLEEIKNSEFRIALVTSSERVVVESMLSITKIDHIFEHTLTRDETKYVKPNPWPYQNMLKTLGINAEEALVFEDSNVGMSSALAAHCLVAKVEWF